MPKALTREDVQDEFKQLVVEIRQIGKIVRENVRQELQRFSEEHSLPSFEDPKPQKWSQNPLAVTPGVSLKQPSATGTSLREAAEIQQEVMPLFRRMEEAIPARATSAPSVHSHLLLEDGESIVAADELTGGQAKACNGLTFPMDFSDGHPFAVEKDCIVQDYSAEADLADVGFLTRGKPGEVTSSKKSAVAKKPVVTIMNLCDDDTYDVSSNGDSDTGSKQFLFPEGIFPGASSRSNNDQNIRTTTSWLPSYRMSNMSEDPLNRRCSVYSEQSLEPRSTVILVLNGSMRWTEALGMFFRSEQFDYIMGVFLMMNAILIGVQVNYMAKQRSQKAPLGWRICDGCFCLVFTVELIIRVALYRGEYLRMKGWQWNLFDLLVVGFSVIDELTKLIFADGSEIRSAIDELFVLKMMRLARVVRLIRMVRLIPELKSMVYLISASMWSFFWTVVLLVIMVYVVAVYYTEMATDIKFDISDEEIVNQLSEHYGSVGRSMFSLFQAITGGDDWRNFVVVFKGQSYLLNSIVFTVYILFATLVMLNLVTGVFVEGAQRIIREDKEAELIKNVRKLFHSTDRDKSGELSLQEFSMLVEHRTMKESLEAVEMSPEQAKAMFFLLDVDNSGELSVEEFVQGCIRMRVPARSIDLCTLKYDFDMITQLWAGQFEELDKNIRSIMSMTGSMVAMTGTLAQATVANMPVEHYVV